MWHLKKIYLIKKNFCRDICDLSKNYIYLIIIKNFFIVPYVARQKNIFNKKKGLSSENYIYLIIKKNFCFVICGMSEKFFLERTTPQRHTPACFFLFSFKIVGICTALASSQVQYLNGK
jgi:hypothetical protein